MINLYSLAYIIMFVKRIRLVDTHHSL